MKTLQENIYKICIGIACGILIVVALTHTTGSSHVSAEIESRMSVNCYPLPQPGTLSLGAKNQAVLWYAIANHGSVPLRISKIGTSFSGNATISDITSATFSFTNDSGNIVTLGIAPFANKNKTAEIQAETLFTIPVGATRDVIVSVDVAKDATLARTAKFSGTTNNFNYVTDAPPALVTGSLPCGSASFTIQNRAPRGELSLSIVSPNGGETWERGSRQAIKWASNNLTPGSYFCKVDLLQNGKVISNLRTMSPGYVVQGASWTIDAKTVPGDYILRTSLCSQSGSILKTAESASTFRIK